MEFNLHLTLCHKCDVYTDLMSYIAQNVFLYKSTAHLYNYSTHVYVPLLGRSPLMSVGHSLSRWPSRRVGDLTYLRETFSYKQASSQYFPSPLKLVIIESHIYLRIYMYTYLNDTIKKLIKSRKDSINSHTSLSSQLWAKF